jgi:acetamidase/formamidase
MARTYYCPADRVHYTWDATHEPALTIDSGDTVVVQTRDVSDNQITPSSTASVITTLNWDRVYPLAGPIAIRGAQPGDVLAVEVCDIHSQGWGWTAIIPGFGLLAEDFREPYLKVFDLTRGDVTPLREDILIPIEPFFGTMGVCPAGATKQAVMPPGVFGGNLDTRQLTRGATLYLPVQIDGALFSCGDAHAAQGDGEVCVTGIEAPMYAALRFALQKNRRIPAPQFTTAGGLLPRVSHAGSYATTGVGPDLMKAAQDSIRAMIDHLGRSHRLSREEAYVLCSLCVDLKISEIVDAGVFVVSAFLPLAVFRTPEGLSD